MDVYEAVKTMLLVTEVDHNAQMLYGKTQIFLVVGQLRACSIHFRQFRNDKKNVKKWV